MQGKIIKGIAGFYYVDVAESGIYECKAKGIFRKEKKKPLVGDNVEIEVLDEKEKTGNPAGSGKCGSGTCDFCSPSAGSELPAVGPLFDYNGTAGDSKYHLFQ